MKKGLTLTLMTVAVAIVGLQVKAMAPVVSDIPSPIVGAVASTTNPTAFVFKDAIDLTQYVSDDNTPTTGILWSYQVAGTNDYLINGIGANTGDLVQPGAFQINKLANIPATESLGAKNNPNSITVRNSKWLPLGATTPVTGAPTSGISNVQLITFVASDGTTYSSPQKGAEVFFYTDFGGQSRLSTPVSTYTPVAGIPGETMTFPGTTHGFVKTINYNAPSTTGSGVVGSSTSGLCFSVPSARGLKSGGAVWGVKNMAQWDSTVGIVPYVDGQLYRFRLTLIGDQVASQASYVPLWDFIINSSGLVYNGDTFICDNPYQGGKNAVLNTDKVFDIYFTPPAVATSGWNDPVTGALACDAAFKAASQPDDTSMSLTFRFIDADETTAIQSWLRKGMVCLKSMQVDRCDINAVQTVKTDWKIDSTNGGFKDCTVGTGGGNFWSVYYGDTTATPTVNVTGGKLYYKPPSNTTPASNQLFYIFPGLTSGAPTAINSLSANFGTTATDADKAIINQLYPVPWNAKTLYRFSADISAGSAPDAQNQTFGIFFIINTVSNEYTAQTLVTCHGGNWSGSRSTAGPGAPTFGKANNTYQSYFYGNTPTGVAQMDYIKPFIGLENLGGPNGGTFKSDGALNGTTVISRIAVDEVTAPFAQ